MASANVEDDLAAASEPGRGRQSRSPRGIPPKGWKDVFWRVWNSITQDRVMFTAAAVAYYLLLALVPTLTAVVSIYGLFADRSAILDQVAMLSGIMPEEGLTIIRDQLERIAGEGNTTLSWTLLISLAIALWSSSAAVKAMFEAMNIAYEEREKRGFFALNLLALVFTLVSAVAGVLVLGAVIILPAVLALLPIGPALQWVLRITSYVLLAAVTVLGLAALYRWGPSRERAKWRWISPGAVFAVVVTLIVSALFSWYVANFGNYSATYGSLGAIIGLLTWMWISATIIIVGAELNSEVEHQTAKDSTTGEEQPLGERGAYMADTVGPKAG
jgi:membrane protein